MTLAGFITRNALRNRRRFALTLFSVAVSLFLLTVLQIILRGLTDPTTTEQAALRVVVRHKVSLANMLFARYQPRLEKMPGVQAVTKLLWFGGVYRDEKNFFPQFACDAGALFDVLVEARIDPRVRERFERQRTACVVGVKTMERFGWKAGDRITLLGAMWPCDLELEIAGSHAGGLDETALYFHHDYFDELLRVTVPPGLNTFRIERDGKSLSVSVVEDMVTRVEVDRTVVDRVVNLVAYRVETRVMAPAAAGQGTSPAIASRTRSHD